MPPSALPSFGFEEKVGRNSQGERFAGDVAGA